MSHEVKYIGMDVHKEATVIAIRNGSGKLIMETIVGTKASSILRVSPSITGRTACDPLPPRNPVAFSPTYRR